VRFQNSAAGRIGYEGLMDGPSAETIIGAGGWHPRYARVLLVEHEGERALVLVDGNGDGAELELEYWFRDADGAWQGGSTSGHGALEHLVSAQSWKAGDFVVALGRTEPGSEIDIQYGGEIYRRRANELGLWGFIHSADFARPGELPSRAAGGG
jgi:hypothetical protein